MVRLQRTGPATWAVFVAISGSSLLSAPNDWAEGLAGHDDGATRDYYNRAALLAWKQPMGDWRDRNDREQGGEPYAAVLIADDDTAKVVSWDVTTLVLQWVQGRFPNQGFFLRALGPSGAAVFASRETGDPEKRPKLMLEGDRGRVVLDAVADTYLTPSTYRSMGHLDTLRVSGQPEHMLLRFSLDSAEQIGSLSRATLQLYTTAQYGDVRVGVFRCWQGHDVSLSEVRWGIAVRYPADRGLRHDKAVWFFEDFESPGWQSSFSQVAPPHTLETVLTDEPRKFQPWQGKALRVRMPQGENTALNTTVRFRQLLKEEPEAVYFRYYLRLADDWNQTLSDGKLPGLSGTYGVAGWGGRRSDGANGWSARGLFRRTIPNGNPLAGTTPIGYYCYHADMKGNYGDHWIWQMGYRGYLERNRWYCIEQFVKLNTPGEPDGVLRGWVDGYLAFEKTDIRFRTTDQLRVEQLWLNIYHGGTPPSPYDQHCYIDNVVVASEYIGPMVNQN